MAASSTTPTESDAAHALRGAPECLVLEPRPNAPRSDKPTVRMFLGTQPAQYRAERGFLFSVERCRDPGRRYEIYLLKELAGFDVGGWTTGFTNYRFAIPHYAACEGKAIYNDADQMYLVDPGELFDLDLNGHGFLAVSPKDSSVALIDCAKMAEIWTFEAARSESKKVLLARATDRPGIYGELDPGWNTRDQDEYDPEGAKCYHFTTLATQPFRPFPERFVYQEHPHGELFYELERAADEAGFHAFTREGPSARFAKVLESGVLDHIQADEGSFAPLVRRLCEAAGAKQLAVSPASSWGGDPGGVRPFSLADLQGSDLPEADGVLCLGGLDRLPHEDLGWVLDSLFASARHFVLAAVRCRETRGPGGMPPHGNLYDTNWWAAQLESASRRHPDVHWELLTSSEEKVSAGDATVHFGGRHLGAAPRVWVLADDRPGNTTQSAGIAEELGWPTEIKRLEFGAISALHNELVGASAVGLSAESRSALCEPWPDLVIAAGGRTAPVARWIKQQSGGRTRLVQLGRKGANPARHFDLSITPGYARLFPHPKRIEISLPLTKVNADSLSAAAAEWEEVFASASEARVAVLVGGDTAKHRFDAEAAKRMGESIAEMVNKAGASVFVTTSRRTSSEAVAALQKALPCAAYFHEWSADPSVANPYLGYLALADALVVTDDSESMLAEACATGKPIQIYPIPTRAPTLLERLKELAVSRAIEKPLGERGTPKPQGGVELFLARLVENGLLRPARDLAAMRDRLAEMDQVRIFDGELVLDATPQRLEMERVCDRIRELMGVRG